MVLTFRDFAPGPNIITLAIRAAPADLWDETQEFLVKEFA
jgi:hypothetical protein